MPDSLDLAQLLAMATNHTTPARQRVHAARAVLDLFKPPKPARSLRRPVVRSPAELHAALDALRAGRGELEGRNVVAGWPATGARAGGCRLVR